MVLETATSTPRMCETRHSNRVRCCIHPRPRPTSRVNAGELRLTTLRRACAKLPLFIIVVVPRSSPCPHIGHGTGCIQNEMFLLSQRRAKAVGSSGQPCVSHVERASGGQLPVWGEGAPKRHVENNKKASEREGEIREEGGCEDDIFLSLLLRSSSPVIRRHAETVFCVFFCAPWRVFDVGIESIRGGLAVEGCPSDGSLITIPLPRPKVECYVFARSASVVGNDGRR